MSGGIRIGEAFIEVRADTQNAFNGVGSAASSEGGRAGGMFSGAFGNSLKSLGTVIGGAFAVDKVKDFLVTSVSGASDLNEEVSKSQTIFGSASGEISSFAQSAAQNLGLSESAALQVTGSFGNMFTQMGFGQSEAAKLSQGVTTLSADLGSFNNLPTAEVADMMSGAFRGEYDSIQRLLPGINAATVEQKALEMSGKDTAAALTDQEKAMAVLQLANEQGANAQGDFAKTSDGLANKSKIVKAEFENMSTTIGTQLLPVVTGFMNFVSSNLIPGLQSIGSFISTEVVPAFNTFKQALSDASPVITTIATVLTAIMLPAIIRSGIQLGITAAAHVMGWGIMSVAAVTNAATVVGAWVMMGIQSMLNAAKMAAAWVVAMGPIGWIITAVVALVVLIIANWDTIKNVTISVFAAVSQFISDVWNNIVTWVTGAVSNMRDTIIMVWTAIKDGINTALEAIKLVITTVWDFIVLFITTYIETVKLIITTGFEIVKNIFTTVWETIKTVVTTVWDGIKNVISSAFEAVKNTVTNALGNIKSFFSDGFNALRGIASNAWENVKSAVSNGVNGAVDLVRSLPDKARNALGNLGSMLRGSGEALIQGFKDGITSAFGKVKDVVSGGLQTIRNLFPFSPAKEGPFSGKGYTSYSGKALSKDFAKGILSNAGLVSDATQDLMGMAKGGLNSELRLNSAGGGRGPSLIGSGASKSHGIIGGNTTVNNHYEVTLDASSVKSFNDIVTMIENLPQVARTGRGTMATGRIA